MTAGDPKAHATPLNDFSADPSQPVELPALGEYVVDTRPLCQGMPFVLTDSAHPRFVLKHGSHFLVLDQSGQVPACNTLGYGYYRYDTRHLSQWELYVNGVPLSLLSADVTHGYAGDFLYTNPQTGDIPQQKLTIQRHLVLSDMLWERLLIENFGLEPLDIELTMKFQSDFADMFEVRGLNRPVRGLRMLPTTSDGGKRLFLAYRGLDNCLMETIVEFSRMLPDSLEDGEAKFRFRLPLRQAREICISIATRWDRRLPFATTTDTDFDSALLHSGTQYGEWRKQSASISTDHELINLSLDRGFRDIYILRQPTPRGYGLAAGVPWYCAVFGRDSAITAWQILPFIPAEARASLEILAAYQGTQDDEFKAEHPGRIMHELRLGELARLNAIPHSPYYGTVDATQLWLMLLGRYVDWTGDLDFASRMWPNVKQALGWLERAMQSGYISYQRESPQGLENQGWKDSGDSVCHSDGSLARVPIALCEAQGYVYAAWLSTARLAELLKHRSLATKLRADAAALKSRFIQDFWMPEENYLALAIDGDGKQVQSVSSNPGHCLWTEILDEPQVNAVADRLMHGDLDSGWGLRTLSSQAAYFNPISYHNGSVWPHDNAIIMEGLRKAGRIADAHKLMQSLMSVAQHQPNFRLPELFCGFERHDAARPIDYPVSCSPQSWAAGSIFQMLSACLNLQPDAPNCRLRIVEPALPQWLKKITIRRLRVGDAELDLSITSEDSYTFCQILRKSGNLRVVIEN